MIKIVSVIGSRPQIIKSAWLSYTIKKFYKKKINEVVIDTNQHYDENLNILFQEKLIKYKPNYILKTRSNKFNLSEKILKIEKILKKEKPSRVIVIGDTKSTLAGAIAAKNLGIYLIHLESGLRSNDNEMLEENIRIITDHLSDELHTPYNFSKLNLVNEGIKSPIFVDGDILTDIFFFLEKKIKAKRDKKKIYFTCHRNEILNNRKKFRSILEGISKLSNKFNVIFPIHPNTKKKIVSYKLKNYLNNTKVIKPLNYLDSIKLLKSCNLVITDSGGLQRESALLGLPCLVIRDETEWSNLKNVSLIGNDKFELIKLTHRNIGKIYKKNKVNLNVTKKIISNMILNTNEKV